MERIWECENEMTIKDLEKRQKEFEKRLEFLEMQTAENISNLDKIYKGLERLDNQEEVKKFLAMKFKELEKRIELLSPKGYETKFDEETGYRGMKHP